MESAVSGFGTRRDYAASATSISTLSLLQSRGTRINQYFRSSSFRAWADSSPDKSRARPANSGPVIRPRIVDGATRTSGLLRMRFTLPDFGLVNT